MRDRRLRQVFVAFALAVSVAAVSSQTAAVEMAAPQGTGTLSGTVIDAGSRAPIAGAAVSYSTDGNRTRTTVPSDEAGRFSFAGVPAGRLFISAQKPSYKSGKPVANATVLAHRLAVTAGQLAMGREEATVTNAQGEFQTPNLSPSRYVLSARPSGGGQARTFHPSARRASGATILDLGPSEVRPNVYVTLVRVPTVEVAGTIGASDALPAGLSVELVEEPSSYGIKNDLGSFSTPVAADGKFAFPSVPAGRYVARVLRFPKAMAAAGD